jgi:hypothetical protein
MKSCIYGILAAFLFVSNACGQVVVDQEYLGNYSTGYYLDYPGDYMAQTFTVRNSGQLLGLGIQVGLLGYPNYAPPIDDLHVRLVRTDASGVPAVDQVLASGSYTWQEVPDFSYHPDYYLGFDLTSSSLAVSAGDILAIVLSSNQTAFSGPGNTYLENHFNYTWHGMFQDPFPGGAFYLYSPRQFGPAPHLKIDHYDPPSSRDMGFRVLVNVPEPPTLTMIAPLLAMLFQRRRFND